MFDTLLRVKNEVWIAVFVAILVYIIGYLIRRFRLKFPPGPIGLPVVGYLPFLSKDVHLKFIELAKKYGDVFSIRLGSVPVVVLNDTASIREAFTKPECLGRPPHSSFSVFGVQSPFFMSDMHMWQEQRRFVVHTLKDLGLGRSKIEEQMLRILFSDEAHFWLNGYVNKQNCRIWSEANPQVYVETPLHPEKLTVWCALWAGGIIGPYFFKNDEGHNVTVNGDRYRAMITNFFIPELNNHDDQELWFQQDGAACHTARATIYLLKDTFGDRLISRFGPVNWPPRTCDLTALDYFLWGYVKSLVYADKP
ncbi:cytochrome P450 18a1 [Trichonephila clavipes]|nr:cytochrome P450 18a1 [Trichonephila clavipes]